MCSLGDLELYTVIITTTKFNMYVLKLRLITNLTQLLIITDVYWLC